MRYLYLTIGFIFVSIGFIGMFIPGIPTTVNILVAAWAFSKSSPRFENWLLNHKVFGQLIRDWRTHRGMSRKAKIKAISFILITFSTTALFVFPLAGDIVFLTLGLILCIYLYSRPEPPVLAEGQL